MKSSEITDAMRLAMHRKSERLTPDPKCEQCHGTGRVRRNGFLLRCFACLPLSSPANVVIQPGQAAIDCQARRKALEKAMAAPAQPVKPKKPAGLAKPRGRKQMNKTEASFVSLLEARKQSGEISRYEWEGATLRWPDGMAYTPDFCVFRNGWSKNDGMTVKWTDMLFIETKGPWIEDDAKVKFRAARAHWPEFMFEMWQRAKDGSWSQIL